MASQVDIQFKVQGIPTDTLWFGQTWGKRAIPFFHAVRGADGWARLKSDTVLSNGLYALMFKRGKFARYTFLSVILEGGRHSFSIETFPDQPYSKALVQNAPLVAAYIQYYDGLNSRLRMRDSLNEMWRLKEESGDFDALVRYEKTIREYQLDIQRQHRGSWLDTVVSWTLLPDPSAYLKNEMALTERKLLREKEYIQSTLNMVKEGNISQKMRCPLWIDRLDLAVFKLYNNPEDSKRFADTLLRALSRNEEAYQYYFTYMVNSFSGMSRYSLDEVFLHLFNNYVKPGKAPWIEEDNRNKLETNALGLPGTLLGDKARNAPVENREGKKLFLDSLLRNKISLLVFWDPECGHCQKELPELKSVCAPFVERGLQVITVCMAKGPRASDCWSFTDSRQLPSQWQYLREPDGSAALSKAYNLRSFPRLYLVDRNKKIVYRRSGEVPAYELEIVLKKIIKN
ncbi:MAG: TlpA family protein disulfide reductase [Flavobacteriales bacterium]|nr:TlpA family protein disulfide reductase [Flavobacteriales bacterium]